MKNKHKRQFLNAYKWYDYSFLLLAMEDWLNNASKVTAKRGTHINADKTAKRMKVMAELAKRIREDNLQTNKVFTSRNNKDIRVMWESHKYLVIRRKETLSLLTTMMNKYLLGFWD
jgi:hypothetical protein